MNKRYQIEQFSPSRPTVVTIGTFDGVHVGHQAIVKQLIAVAEVNDLEPTILSFFPHPRMVLQQDDSIRLIHTIEERIATLHDFGVDAIVIYPFSKEFSRMTALEYVRDILVEKLNVKKIIIGYNHRFGRNRAADIKDLIEYGALYDFEVIEITAQQIEEVSVSSTKIRNALNAGDVAKANAYLGHSFELSGSVQRGKSIGRTIGFPTANIKIEESYKLIPKNGVYIVSATIDHVLCYGMMNIGVNPTVSGTKRSIEVYFLDFDKDLYDQKVTVQLLSRIRNEQRFTSLEALQEQLQLDLQTTKQYIVNNV